MELPCTLQHPHPDHANSHFGDCPPAVNFKMLSLCMPAMQLGRLQRDGRISSDEQHSIEDDVQAMTDQHCAVIDGLIEHKTKELTSP